MQTSCTFRGDIDLLDKLTVSMFEEVKVFCSQKKYVEAKAATLTEIAADVFEKSKDVPSDFESKDSRNKFQRKEQMVFGRLKTARVFCGTSLAASLESPQAMIIYRPEYTVNMAGVILDQIQA